MDDQLATIVLSFLTRTKIGTLAIYYIHIRKYHILYNMHLKQKDKP